MKGLQLYGEDPNMFSLILYRSKVEISIETNVCNDVMISKHF